MAISKKVAVKAGGTLAVFALLASPIVATAATDDTTITANIGSTITVANNNNVILTLNPTTEAVTSSASDAVTVATNSAGGYELTIEDSDSDTDLTSDESSFPTTSGDQTDPTALGENSWGYAVANHAGFDGSYNTLNNATSDTSLWAGMPVSGSAEVIASNNAPANDTTTVWFAARVGTEQAAGSYTNTVTYTATAQP